jgi:hypothetical protein
MKKKRIVDNPWDPPGWRGPSIYDDCAPEHLAAAREMIKDYPRDEWGKRIPDSRRDLVVDPRPAVMIPPRQTYKNKI